MYSGQSMSDLQKITKSIIELEELTKKLKWWEIARKIRYNNELSGIRKIEWNIGFNMAIDDLEKAGVLKKLTL